MIANKDETTQSSLAWRKAKRRLRKLNQNWQFLLTYVTCAALTMGGIGSINYIVDPYSVFHSSSKAGFNHIKPKKENNDRLYKATDIIRLKPRFIFLGSSRVKQGLNPAYLENQPTQPVYNLGLNGTNTYEVLRYLQHAIANQADIQTVIYGVDFFTFDQSLQNRPTFNENRLEKNSIIPKDWINATLSLQSLSDSWLTVRESRNDGLGSKIDAHDGFDPVPGPSPIWRFEKSALDYFQAHAEYQLSRQHLEHFRQIVDLCKQHNIQLYVFISPSHATQWESIRLIGQWETFEAWKRELAQITPVWDFSGYNSVTAEPLSEQMQNHRDTSHYTETVGNYVLDRLLAEQANQAPEDFGVLLSPETIDDHLTQIRLNRTTWAAQNPEDLEWIEAQYADFQTP